MPSSLARYPERRRRAPRADVRERVLAAARQEFAARGFDGVSLDHIAAVAGFSKGAVYSNFATKSELFLALLDESVAARLAVATDLDSGHDKGNPARRLGDRLVSEFAADADWQLLLIEFWMRAMRDPSIRKPFVEYRRKLRGQIANEYRRLVPDGDAEVDAMQIATIVLALSNGIAIERLLDPNAADNSLLGIALGRVITPTRESDG